MGRCCVLKVSITHTGEYMKTITAVATLSILLSLAPSAQAESKRQFCNDRSSSKSIKSNKFTSSSFLSFRNQGGLLNAGVCWWHSRFQRNSMLLAKFRPNLPAPTTKEAKKIIKAIRKGKKVVEVPGFKNMRNFSYYYSNEIQRELEKWQKGDGILRQQWIVGLAGSHEISAEKLSKKMDELYDYVKVQGNIAYEKLQIDGIDAHAWIVGDMERTSRGYDLKVLDSNYQQTQVYKYRRGMTSFHHNYYGTFVPYLERKREYKKVLKTVSKYCK